jgi:hypothetical protein
LLLSFSAREATNAEFLWNPMPIAVEKTGIVLYRLEVRIDGERSFGVILWGM